MALQRSKSAPHGVPALLPVSGGLLRASSYDTIQKAIRPAKRATLAVVKERVVAEPEDAFILGGFFPSALGEEHWGWLRGEDKVKQKQETWAIEAGDSLFGEEDSARETIKLEDKFGVLSLGGLLQELEGQVRQSWGEMRGGTDREAVDEDTLWLGLRDRRGRTVGAGGDLDGDVEDWKTPVDSAIDEYFPIWDIAGGNSRDTKLPQVERFS